MVTWWILSHMRGRERLVELMGPDLLECPPLSRLGPRGPLLAELFGEQPDRVRPLADGVVLYRACEEGQSFGEEGVQLRGFAQDRFVLELSRPAFAVFVKIRSEDHGGNFRLELAGDVRTGLIHSQMTKRYVFYLSSARLLALGSGGAERLYLPFRVRSEFGSPARGGAPSQGLYLFYPRVAWTSGPRLWRER
jgi:hypothetical protein